MAIHEILVAPHPILKKKAAPISGVDDAIRQLFDDMLETMYHADGIGLAAPQIGVSKRVVVIGIKDNDGKKNEYFLANPEIIYVSDEQNTYQEGCLSVPEQYEEVVRPKYATIRYLDYDGYEQTMECDELLATCIQHEIDHLNGIIFIDHLSKIKRDMIVRKLKKIKKNHSIN